MALVLIEEIRRKRGTAAVCRCECGQTVTVPMSEFQNGHKQTCGSKVCTSKLLSSLKTGKKRPDLVGKVPHNKLDRTGKRYGRLVALKDEGNGRWLCQCDCGNTSSVLSTNLANMAKNDRGCTSCGNRQDITGEKIGLLTAVESESGAVKGRHPLWLFRCGCGGSIRGTVREFHAQRLRSCGCHDCAHASWKSMLSRCYDPKNNRYKYYGGRGIKVHPRWHKFANFVEDMGERPKRHNLSRKHAERNYSPANCEWEHISKNTADTSYGKPTKAGLKKGAKPRRYVR